MKKKKKKKEPFYYTEIPLLPMRARLHVIVCRDRKRAKKRSKKHLGKDGARRVWADIHKGNTGFVSGNGFNQFLWLQEFVPGEIVHEAVHVTHRLSRDFGTEINEESQEWQAYMVQYIFDEIEKMRDQVK